MTGERKLKVAVDVAFGSAVGCRADWLEVGGSAARACWLGFFAVNCDGTSLHWFSEHSPIVFVEVRSFH